MNKAIKRIMVGFLFISLDINIGFIDILNNSLGFIIIIYGLKDLVEHSLYFTKAIHVARFLVLINIPYSIKYGEARDGMNLNFLSNFYPLDILYTIIVVLINIYFVYNLCRGFSEMTKKYEHTSRSFMNFIKAYTVICSISMLLLIFNINLNIKSIKDFIIFFSIGLAFWNICFLVLLNKTRKMDFNLK
ncbi:hypothetical protein KQI89_16060 [Clostridium sp. MSJ-4]|uniref:DUF5658 domain-containing protein n=1 Tax=Clostridium simiarum TaxID=2841506 RepID=A0ABS6F426_9CLOT|nr:hypothetical protein [Clostridium simiarum]MBU5593264.1 hypothetical protein [Clostridium simiarum]